MQFIDVEEINRFGFVKAFSIPKNIGRWRIYSYDIKDNMHDIMYYSELGKSFNITPDNMIRALQSHTASVFVAKANDGGLGVTRMEPKTPYDGFITNEKKVMLLTVEADCTPVYILDPVRHAIGMVHSGWRGTRLGIVNNAINLMSINYGSDVKDLIVHFGPAICGNCYEVGIELIAEFKNIFKCDEVHAVFKPILDKEEKYTLDVTEAIRLSILKMGVKEENITRDLTCTFHDDIYDSWRRDHDKTKQMLTGIMLIND